MVRDTYLVFKYAAREYGVDRVNRMSAAVAYRGLFAMAPLLILTVYVVGIAVGSEAARAEILEAIDRVAGPTVVDAVDTILLTMSDPGAAAGVVGFVLLLWTSSSLFLELQNDLNDIFDVPYDKTTGILETVRKRGLGFLWALALGLILILVLLLNNIWQFLGSLLPGTFDPVNRVVSALTPFVSFVVLPLVIGLFIQTLSQVKVRWRAIWWGSLFTTVAFLVTSYGVSLYFRLSSTSAAQIAGAVFVILLAAYIFAAVFLFGAEVTRAYELYLETGSPPEGTNSSVHKEAEPITSRDDGN
jgi:membrane protein